MFSFLIIFPLLFTLSASALTDLLSSKSHAGYNTYAVLVAGSNTHFNYRHQAHVCHTYQILINHGVPAKNIIVMMYDDIAYDQMNPFPGQIFNAPNGTDVYAGVVKDYTGEEVTAENFLGVLKGDKTLAAMGKKVLTTGPNDNVFIYYAGHGGVGLLGFPSSCLSSHDLNEALVYMHDNKMYGKLTIHLEACESGSMFENILQDNLKIRAITSSNSKEISFSCYCDTHNIGTCFEDEYSASWLDYNNLTRQALEQQFTDYGENSPSLDPQQFGQKSLISTILKAGRSFLFRGVKKVVTHLCVHNYCKDAKKVMLSRRPLVKHETYAKVAKKFHSKCLNLGVHTFGMKFMHAFADIVESNDFNEVTLNRFMEDLEKACKNHIVGHNFKAII
ncbi:legumain-like [Tetranychus urticae]|nr:legumain-like [Tetranychus urticae]